MVAMGPRALGGIPAPRTCRHLAPLERLVTAGGWPLGPAEPCPHDPDWGTWYYTDAPLDVPALNRRMPLDPCVRGEDYVGSLSDGDVTYFCTCCHKAIVGRLPPAASAAMLAASAN